VRYQSQSHEVLYGDLQAGVPEVVKSLAAEWAVMQQTLDAVTQALQADLNRLFQSWSASSGQEFDTRVNLVTAFSQELSTGMEQVSRGLDVMGDQLVQAKQEAEQNTPDAADDPDKTIKATAIGFLTGGPAGAIAGGLLGHKMDEQEKEQARERIVETVTDLASGYDAATDEQWPKSAAKPPPGLPGKPSSTYDPDEADSSDSPVADPDMALKGANGEDAAIGGAGGGPSLSGLDGIPGQGSGALGNHGLSTALMIGAAVAGAAGLAGAIRGAPDMAANTTKLGSGGMMGGMPGAGVSGVLGKDDKAARAGGRAGGAGTVGGAGGAGSGSGGARGDRHGMLGQRGASGEEEEEDERTTWLTEDEMPWTGSVPPPPVLGAPEE
jgi:uncharacterized protein YukE